VVAVPRAGGSADRGTQVIVSAEISGYGDSDAVFVTSPTVSASVGDEVAGWSVSGRYLVDAVSAASVDIISSASGKWTELRHAGSAVGMVKLGETGVAVATDFSREPDYLSLGGGVTISRELLEKNFTPFVGASYSHDDVGRTGEPKSSWRPLQRWGGQAGANFVVDRSTTATVILDGFFERGYLAKPYRYIPLFAPGVAAQVPAGASVDEVNRLRLDLRPADALPDARDRYAAALRLAHRWESATFRIDERIYKDSWGGLASTTDIRHSIDVGTRLLVWPHLRLHAQRGIDFWQRAYEAAVTADGSVGVPSYRTGDRELGPLLTATVGLGLRWRLSRDGAAPWTLFGQVEGIFTRYFDALYIVGRRAIFSALGIEMGF
jgi:hypothetical protein